MSGAGAGSHVQVPASGMGEGLCQCATIIQYLTSLAAEQDKGLAWELRGGVSVCF